MKDNLSLHRANDVRTARLAALGRLSRHGRPAGRRAVPPASPLTRERLVDLLDEALALVDNLNLGDGDDTASTEGPSSSSSSSTSGTSSRSNSNGRRSPPHNHGTSPQ